MKWGIDVSRWQGNFNFDQAKAEGVEFAILKAGGGDAGLYKDGKFERNYVVASALMPVGAYFFGQAMDTTTAMKEAEYFCKLLQGKSFPMRVWYDVEAKMLNAKNLSTIVITFIERMRAGGYDCGIYASESVLKTLCKTEAINNYPHWTARWSKTPPSVQTEIWQFGGETNYIRSNKVAGVVCDQNYLMGSVNIPTPAAPAKKSNEEIAAEVWKGLWGDAKSKPTRKERLEAAGYDYAAIQKIVNATKPTTSEPVPQYYTVKKGDTASGIAKKNGITLTQLKKLNPSQKNWNLIYPGQKFRIK